MKKHDFKKLAIMGIASSALFALQSGNASDFSGKLSNQPIASVERDVKDAGLEVNKADNAVKSKIESRNDHPLREKAESAAEKGAGELENRYEEKHESRLEKLKEKIGDRDLAALEKDVKKAGLEINKADNAVKGEIERRNEPSRMEKVESAAKKEGGKLENRYEEKHESRWDKLKERVHDRDLAALEKDVKEAGLEINKADEAVKGKIESRNEPSRKEKLESAAKKEGGKLENRYEEKHESRREKLKEKISGRELAALEKDAKEAGLEINRADNAVKAEIDRRREPTPREKLESAAKTGAGAAMDWRENRQDQPTRKEKLESAAKKEGGKLENRYEEKHESRREKLKEKISGRELAALEKDAKKAALDIDKADTAVKNKLDSRNEPTRKDKAEAAAKKGAGAAMDWRESRQNDQPTRKERLEEKGRGAFGKGEGAAKGLKDRRNPTEPTEPTQPTQPSNQGEHHDDDLLAWSFFGSDSSEQSASDSTKKEEAGKDQPAKSDESAKESSSESKASLVADNESGEIGRASCRERV